VKDTSNRTNAARRRKRTRRRQKRSARRTTLGVALIAVVGLLGALVVGALAVASSFIDSLPDIEDVKPVDLGQNSAIYAADGSRLGVIAANHNRTPVRWRQISPFLRNATIAIEDKRYWEHGALDYEGIARAAWRDLTTGSFAEGGSTITQQVVRNLYIPQEKDKKTFQRKIDEAWLAIQFERNYTKADILTTYLNIVFYGNNAYGAEAAAQTYYSKHAIQLTLAQSALIAGLPQAPTDYDPFTHPWQARARRNQVLNAMREGGFIKKPAYLKALKECVCLKPSHVYRVVRQRPFFDYVKERLSAKLDPVSTDLVPSGGLRIETTLDPRLQFAARRAIKSVLKTPGDPVAVIVSIDPKTGHILAMQSSASSGLHFNIATQATRQAGSTFKAIALTTAVNMGVDPYHTYYSGGSQISIPIPGCEIPGACEHPYWDVHTYHGEGGGGGTLASALLRSDNVVFAQVSYDVDPENIVKIARALGVNKSPIKPDLSIALGAEDVTPLEMTSAYATLAAGGVYHPPQPIKKVLRRGVPVGDFAPKQRRVISDGVAAEVVKVLEENMTSGLGTTARTSDGRPQGGKTGTTDNSENAWFCGFTPNLATCVWMGYVKANIPMINVEGVGAVSGPTLPSQIWHAYMDVALKKFPPVDFPQPTDAFVSHQVDLHYGRQGYYYSAPPAAPSTPTIPTDTAPTDTTSTDSSGAGQATQSPVGGDTTTP
jgi:penicillin-binding protein 1A